MAIDNKIVKDLRLSPRSCGITNSFCSFLGFPAEEVASPLTKLGVVKTDGRKGEVRHCFIIDGDGLLSFLYLIVL